MRPFTLLLTCSLFGLASLAVAQERSSSSPINTDAGLQTNYAQGLQNDLGNLNGKLASSCTAADGSSKAVGTSWLDACPAGQHGSGISRVCDKGVVVSTQNNCFAQNDCGTHPADSTWAGSCPAGTTGALTYRCINGTTTIDSAGSTCAIPNCTGKSYAVACPASTADGIQMYGTMTFQCVNNQQMVLTGTTCQTYNRPCGSTGNGGTVGYSCASIGGGAYGGTLNLTCSNSTNYISYFGCTM